MRGPCKRFTIKDNGTGGRSARGLERQSAEPHSFFSLRTMRVVTRRTNVTAPLRIWLRGCGLVASKPSPLQFTPAFARDRKALKTLKGAAIEQDEAVRKLRAHWSKLGFWPLGNSAIHLLLLAPQNTTNHRTDCLLSHHEQLCLKTPGSRNTISGWKTSKTVPPTMIAVEDARNVGFQFVFGSISLPCYREPHRIKNLGGRLGHTRQEAH